MAHEMKVKLEERREELEELKHRAEVFNSKVKYLEDERGIEEELRNRFDVAKSGEKVIILLDERSEDPRAEGNTSLEFVDSPHEEKSFFESLKFWE